MTKFATLMLAGVAVIAAVPAAAQITGTGLPSSNAALAGGTVVDFETAAPGSATTRTYGSLTITGLTVVENTYAGQYNSYGTQYLQNNAGNTSTVVFTFATPVSAFGFNLGAADYNWTLTSGSQTYVFTPTFGGNDKNYYGISGSGLTSATLTFAATDYVLIDNITYRAGAAAAVPEPATWALMLAGFGAVGYAMRRRIRRSDAQFDARIKRITEGTAA